MQWWSCRVLLNVEKFPCSVFGPCWSLVSPPLQVWSGRYVTWPRLGDIRVSQSELCLFLAKTVQPARWASVMNISTMRTLKISFPNPRSRCLLNRSGGSSSQSLGKVPLSHPGESLDSVRFFGGFLVVFREFLSLEDLKKLTGVQKTGLVCVQTNV